MSELLLDRAGRRRSPATLPGFHAGHAPGNKGLRYPAEPPKVEEIIAVMRAAGDAVHGPVARADRRALALPRSSSNSLIRRLLTPPRHRACAVIGLALGVVVSVSSDAHCA